MKSTQHPFEPVTRFLSTLLNRLISPHPSIVEVGMRRQAQFSAAIALLLSTMLFLQIVAALATGRLELGTRLGILYGCVLLGYGLSRGRFPQWGSVLLIFGFTLFAFIISGQQVADVSTTLYGMIPIAYVLAGVLLSAGWQIALVIFVAAGSVILGAMQTMPGVNMRLLGGNLVALGVILIFTSKLRDGIEKRRLNQVQQINRQLEDAKIAVQGSEQRFRALLAAIPDMVFELSRGGIFLDFIPSATLEPIMPPENFLGRSITEVMPPEIALMSMQVIEQALASNQVQTFEYQLPLGGAPHHFEARMVASQSEAVVVFVRDITEHKRTEEVLRESEGRFRSFVEATTDGIMFFDSQGRVIEWNNAFERMTGLARKQALGMFAWDVEMQFTPDEARKNLDLERLKLIFHQTFETGALPASIKNPREARIQHVDGSCRIAEQRLFLIRTIQGFALGVVLHDITERKRAEVEREALIKDLEARNAELERFTYTISHDLKSPLFTIGGFLGYLERDALAGDAERLRDDIARIQNATEKMKTLLDELLELSRIGRMMNPSEDVSFEDIVRQSLELASRRLDARHVRVTVAENLPVVHGDRARFIEVMQNLVDNAAKFMGDQPEPHIEIGQHGEEDGKPVFFVRDNGIGIAPEYRERIFGIFNKLDPNAEGTGVGLALVKRIIEFHGGRIWVESELGKGATFCFTLSPAKVN